MPGELCVTGHFYFYSFTTTLFSARCCDNYCMARCGIGALPVEEDYGLRISARYYRVVKVRMSMDHEVVGHWFNEEVKDNLALLDEVEQAARTG
jgi:hypothetical protein